MFNGGLSPSKALEIMQKEKFFGVLQALVWFGQYKASPLSPILLIDRLFASQWGWLERLQKYDQCQLKE